VGSHIKSPRRTLFTPYIGFTLRVPDLHTHKGSETTYYTQYGRHAGGYGAIVWV
jgi:hypothetical protein